MKNIIKQVLLSAIIVTTVFGCDLNLKPISEVGENDFYKNDSQVESGVIAIYDGLQEVPLREFALTEMRTDNTHTKSHEGQYAQFDNFNVKPTNGIVANYWNRNYNVIFRANKVLEEVKNVNNKADRKQYEGEAKFTRALSYFKLVRAFGDVPLVTKVIKPDSKKYFDRDPKTDVLDSIKTDLKEASSLLPGKSEMDFGRATSGAAQSLLAKVYLRTDDYSKAQTRLENVVSSQEYKLMDNYKDVFYSEGNDEIIFAIPYKDDSETESQDFSFEMTAGGRNSGLNFLTDNFVQALRPEDTERIPVLRNPDKPREVGKFITQSSDARLDGNDWIVLRLADVYLMHAEAILAGDQSTKDVAAIKSYNKVRARVGLSTLPEDGSAELTLDQLMIERRMELAFENHRLYDLERVDRATSVLSDFADDKGYTFSKNDLLLPIPQTQINVSSGLLEQNPGYH